MVGAIKETKTEIERRVRAMYETAINNQRPTKKWKRGIGVIIQKPGKRDHTNVKYCRPVSLLYTLGKDLEKMVRAWLGNKGEKDPGRFNSSQWGERRERSSEEAVWATKKEEKGKKVILVMTDVTQGFPNVAKGKPAKRVRTRSMPERVARWTQDFLSDRWVKVKVKGDEADGEKVEAGIPLDSPRLPVLFNRYIVPLLREGKERTKKWGKDITSATFVDDVTSGVATETWQEAIARAEEILVMAGKWGENRDRKFEEDKMK